MSQRTPSPQELQQVHDLAAGWGKIVARRASAESGPDTPLDFQAMEQIAARSFAQRPGNPYRRRKAA
jgi:hypothetical protein